MQWRSFACRESSFTSTPQRGIVGRSLHEGRGCGLKRFDTRLGGRVVSECFRQASSLPYGARWVAQDQAFHKTGKLPADAAVPATHVRYYVLAVGCGLSLLLYLHRQSFVRAHPDIGESLGLNAEQFGNMQSAFLIGYAIFQVPCGLIGDRLGARALLTFLMLAWSLMTGITALGGSLSDECRWAVRVSAGGPFLFGVFQAGFFPVWSRVIADWIPITERGSAQGFVWMFSRLGGAVSPFLFLGLLDLCGTWTTPFWLEAGLGVVVAVPFWIWFRNRPEQMRQVNAAERALIAAGRPDVGAACVVRFRGWPCWGRSTCGGCV